MAVKVGADGGAMMGRALATIWLGLCSLFTGAALVFDWMVASRDGVLDMDWPVLGFGLSVLALPTALAWWMRRRGWLLAAMALAAAPVGVVVYLLATFHMRMF
ncbi:hypothetical protein ACO2Q3_10345 [Caulobacter sp. KR2-114]|uniref:hypothetical protein n=1 Tax=Caulobacter sp. KR2-114 TaxID=3400912 RepID=UPI003C0A1972